MNNILCVQRRTTHPSRVMPIQVMVDGWLCWLTRTRGHDGLIKTSGGLLGHTPPRLDFHGASGRGRRPWLCKHAPSSGAAVEGLSAVEAMAGRAQDDNFFLTSSKWWIVGSYTSPRSIFTVPAVGGIAHGSVNTRPRAERARTAHRQKKEP